MIARRLVLQILLLSAPASAEAQLVAGNLEGRVLDARGELLQSATVVVKSPSLQGVRGASTRRGWVFQIAGFAGRSLHRRGQTRFVQGRCFA